MECNHLFKDNICQNDNCGYRLENDWEKLGELLPESVNRFRVYEIIERIEKRAVLVLHDELIKKISAGKMKIHCQMNKIEMQNCCPACERIKAHNVSSDKSISILKQSKKNYE